MKSLIIAGLALIFTGYLPGQQPAQAFEVAAIRPNPIGASAGTGFDFNGTSLRVTNATLQYLIRSAYRMQGDQIIGGPAWLSSDRFDIDAKTTGTEKIASEQFRAMLQNLLADRFHLRVHSETREMTVYALIPDRAGSKLREDTDGGGSRFSTEMGSGKAVLTGTRVSMEQLTGYIGDKLGRVVLDKTGLKGNFDFTFEWDPEQAADGAGPSMFTGLREQMGLKLESTKAPVDVLVIDHVEKPSEN